MWGCGIPKDKGLMCMSQTLTAGWPRSQPRTVGNKRQELLVITCSAHGKEQDVAGEGGHVEVGQHLSGTNILILVPGDGHKRRK